MPFGHRGAHQLPADDSVGSDYVNIGHSNNYAIPFFVKHSKTDLDHLEEVTGGIPLHFTNADIGYRRLKRRSPLINDLDFRRNLETTDADGLIIAMETATAPMMYPSAPSSSAPPQRQTLLKLALPTGCEPEQRLSLWRCR